MINKRPVFAACGSVLAMALLPAVSFAAEQSPSPTVTTLYEFAGTEPNFPTSMIGASGVLYGIEQDGLAGAVVYSLTPPASPGLPWTKAVLWRFTGDSNEAPVPEGTVVMGASGVLYGVTHRGGTSSYGTVFSLAPPAVAGGAWTHTTLLSLSGGDGALPYAVTVGSGGVLFVVAQLGGHAAGTILSLTPPTSDGGPWTESVLHKFAGGTGGGDPVAAVVIGSGGVLYGTAIGPTGASGVVFSMTPPESQGGSWTYAVLGNVSGQSSASLVIGAGGVLYGTTGDGGTYNDGTAFSVAPPSSPGGLWTASTLYSFMGGTDGFLPASNLIIGAGGVLYGVTPYGGNGNSTFLGDGTIFSLTPPTESGGTWTEAVLYTFTGGSTGGYPGGLVATTGGKFYGFAEDGGSDGTGDGSVFSFVP